MKVWEIYAAAVSEYKAKNFDAALELLEDVKKVAPTYRKAYLLEAYIWRDRKNVVKEYNALVKLLPLFDLSDPAQRDLASNALSCFATACLSLEPGEEAVKLNVLAAEIVGDNVEACASICNAVFAATFIENFSADDFQKLYAEYKKYLPDIAPYPKKFYAHEKIRVGFLSADFCIHPVMNWAWALIRDLNKNFFMTYCYSSTGKSDIVTEYIKASVENWRDISKLKDAQAAELIRGDGVIGCELRRIIPRQFK